jgi:hypothetical protein
MEWSGATPGPIRINSFFALSLGLQVGLCRVEEASLLCLVSRADAPNLWGHHISWIRVAKQRLGGGSTDGACRPRNSPVDWSRCENFSFQSQRTQRH